MEKQDTTIRDRAIRWYASEAGPILFVKEHQDDFYLTNNDSHTQRAPEDQENRQCQYAKVQFSFRVTDMKRTCNDHTSIKVVAGKNKFLKVLCFQKETTQYLLPHQVRLAKQGPKFDVDNWLLVNSLPDEYFACKSFVQDSYIRNHTLTPDWHLTMSVFVADKTIARKGIPNPIELLFLGGLLNIFQKTFYDEYCKYFDINQATKHVSDVVFGWADINPDALKRIEELAVGEAIKLASRLAKNELALESVGCRFDRGFYPGKKNGKHDDGIGWSEVCKQVRRKSKDMLAANEQARELVLQWNAEPRETMGDVEMMGEFLNDLGIGDLVSLFL